MFGFNGFGCSGMTLSSADGKHFWARNYDFPSAEGSTVTLVPRGFDFCHQDARSRRYAVGGPADGLRGLRSSYRRLCPGWGWHAGSST